MKKQIDYGRFYISAAPGNMNMIDVALCLKSDLRMIKSFQLFGFDLPAVIVDFRVIFQDTMTDKSCFDAMVDLADKGVFDTLPSLN